MTRSTRRVLGGGRLVAAGLAAATVSLLLAACAPGETGSPEETAALPSGSQGAVEFDEFAIVLGDGDIEASLWFDLRCPGCRAFEESAGEEIAQLVADGTITYTLHPMTFLDRLSAGSEYSSRAASALTCVAADDPERTLDVMAALFAAQPPEGTEGLTDDELTEVVADAGVADVADCIAEGRYIDWVTASNDAALAGIEGADIPAISGTPTLVVDGTAYTGNPGDGDSILTFIASGGGE